MSRFFLVIAVFCGLTLGGCGVDWFPEPAATTTDSSDSSDSSNGSNGSDGSGTSVATVADLVLSTPTLAGVAAGTAQTSSLTVTLTSGTSAPISVIGGEYSTDNGATFKTTPGTVANGDQVIVRHTAASADLQTVSTTLTIGDKIAVFSSTTAPPAVATFSFVPSSVQGVPINSLQTSQPVTVALTSGTAAAVSVTGGKYSTDNGATFDTAAGSVAHGDTVIVQHNASGVAGGTVSTTLTIGDKSSTFSSTTASSAPPVIATAFSFAPVSGAVADSQQTSNSITVALSGGTSAAISVAGGLYNINDGSFVATPGIVNNGDTVSVRHTAASGNLQTVATTLTIADKSAIFSSTTAPVTVAGFTFSPALVSGLPGVVKSSDPVTVQLSTGASAAISVTGGTYAINGGAFTAGAGTVKNGDTVIVRNSTPAVAGQMASTTLTIGNKNAIFSSIASNVTVTAPFSFGTTTGALPGTSQTSSLLTITLVNGTSAPISISGGEYRINNGAFTTASGTVRSGNTVIVRHTAASGAGQQVSTTVTIGGSSATFTSTTRTP